MTSTSTDLTVRAHFSLKGFFASWLILACLTALWSFATPISGAPDEPAHLIKAASVVRGQLLGENVHGGQLVTVPRYIAYSRTQSCVAFHTTRTPQCARPLEGNADANVETDTSAGLYNPTYYFLVGWPSLLFHDETGIYAMRIVSGVLGSLFLAACVGLILCWRNRSIAVLGIGVALTPMVIFINGVINPSSLETAATMAAFVGMVSIILSPAREAVNLRSAIVFVAAAVAINTRGISPLWVAVALLLPFILVTRARFFELVSSWAVRLATAGIALSLGAALLWTRLSNSLGAGLQPAGDTPPVAGMGDSPLHGFSIVFNGTLQYGEGIIGVFGWLDTHSPVFTLFVWSSAIVVAVVAALAALRGRHLVLALSLIAAVLLLPPAVQALYITGGGLIWQGRYTIPLFVCAIIGISALLDHQRFDSGMVPITRRRVFFLVPLALFAAQAMAFVFTLKRYTVGFGRAHDLSWGSMFLHPEWNPPGTSIGLTIAFILIAGFAFWLLFLTALHNPDSENDSTASPTSSPRRKLL